MVFACGLATTLIYFRYSPEKLVDYALCLGFITHSLLYFFAMFAITMMILYEKRARKLKASIL